MPAKKITFATEVPTKYLNILHPVIDTHFVIASYCLEDEEYYNWYKNRPKDCKIMLDNGMFEGGKPLSPEALFEVATVLNPDLVFAPDQVGDMDGTLIMSEEFIHLTLAKGGRWRLGLIPQGKDPEEIATCYSEMCNLAYFYNLAVTYGISFLNDRPKVIEAIMANGGPSTYPGDNHHFLGLYNTDEITTWPDWVDSCDTIKPFKAACFDYLVEDCPRGLGKWSTKMVCDNDSLLFRNIAKMHTLLTKQED